MSLIKIAKQVIETEIQGLDYMSNQLNDDFLKAIDAIISTKGRTIICGMGKSGIIGRKIAASFASTGTVSFFIHPGEAFHGDLGMVKKEDVFVAISNSGETDEVLKLLPFLKENGNFIISITGNEQSSLARNSHCHLNIGIPKEACPLQLAPTTSTTATLVMGDALTVALMNKRKFRLESFARFHPGGSLGRKLLCKVEDVMHFENLPIVSEDASFIEVIHSISNGKLGVTIVKSEDGNWGLITDGDLRRAMEKQGKDVFDIQSKDFASYSPLSISFDMKMHDAIEIMDKSKVSSLLVMKNNSLVGILKK